MVGYVLESSYADSMELFHEEITHIPKLEEIGEQRKTRFLFSSSPRNIRKKPGSF